MSATENTQEAKPEGTKDQEVASLKENVHYEAVEAQGTLGLSDEEEDPHVTFKTWVVVWVSIPTSLPWTVVESSLLDFD